MSSVVSGHESGEQVELGRSNWLSHEIASYLEEAIDNPDIGPEKTLAIILHHGLGLSLNTVAKLQGTTKNVVVKRVLTGTKRLAAQPTWEAPEDAEPAKTVDEWLTHYLVTCDDLQPSTRRLYEVAQKRLSAMFGGRPLPEITQVDALAFRQSLTVQSLTAQTVANMESAARCMFRGAQRAGLIAANPFRKTPAGKKKGTAAAGTLAV